MTHEKLLGLSAEDWKTISDEDLYKIYEPFFQVTRPERANPSGSKSSTGSPSKGKAPSSNTNFASLQRKLMEQATLAGIVLPSSK